MDSKGDQNQGSTKVEELIKPPQQLRDPSKQQLQLLVQKFFNNLTDTQKSNKKIWQVYRKAFYYFIDKMISKQQRKIYNCKKKNFDMLLSKHLPLSLQKTYKQLKKLKRLYQSRDIGGVIIKDTQSNQFLMVQGQHNNLGFAKGKLEQNQTYRDAAIRQAQQQVQIQGCNLVITKPYTFFHVQAGSQNMRDDSSDEQFDAQDYQQLNKMSSQQQKRITRGKDCIFFYAQIDKLQVQIYRQGKEAIDEVVAIHWVDFTQGIQAVEKMTGKRITMISKDVIYDIFDSSPDFRASRYNSNFPSLTKSIDMKHPTVTPNKNMQFSQINYGKDQQKIFQIVKNAIDFSKQKIQLIPTMVLFEFQTLGLNNNVIPKIADLLREKGQNWKSKLFYCSTSRNGKNAICRLASRLGLKSEFIFKEWTDKEPKQLAQKLYIDKDSQLILCQPYSLAEFLNRNRMYYVNKKKCNFDWKNCILYLELSNKMYHSDFHKIFQILSAFPPKVVLAQFNFSMNKQAVENLTNLIKVVYPNLKFEHYISQKKNTIPTQKSKSERQILFEKIVQSCPNRIINHFQNFPFMYLRGSKFQVGCPRNIFEELVYVAEQSEEKTRIVQYVTLLFYGLYGGVKCILTPSQDQSVTYMSSALTIYDLPRKLNTHYSVQTIDKYEFHRNQAMFVNFIIKNTADRIINYSTNQRFLDIFAYEDNSKSYVSLFDFHNQSTKTLYIPVLLSQEDFQIFSNQFLITQIRQYVLWLDQLCNYQGMKQYQGLLNAVNGISQANIDKHFSLVRNTKDKQLRMIKTNKFESQSRQKYQRKARSNVQTQKNSKVEIQARLKVENQTKPKYIEKNINKKRSYKQKAPQKVQAVTQPKKKAVKYREK